MHKHGCLISWHTNSHMSWIKWQTLGNKKKKIRAADLSTLIKHWPSQMYKHQEFGLKRQTNFSRCKHSLCVSSWPGCLSDTSGLNAWSVNQKWRSKPKIYTVYRIIYSIYILFSLLKVLMLRHYSHIPNSLCNGQQDKQANNNSHCIHPTHSCSSPWLISSLYSFSV